MSDVSITEPEPEDIAVDEDEVFERPTPPKGWTVIARKEMTDYFLSARFTVLLAVLGLAGAAAVAASSSLISDAAPVASTIDSIFLRIYTVPPTEQIPAFTTIVGFLAPLLGIAFGFDAVNGERAQGTLPRLVSQPIHRDDVINGKFVAGLGVIAAVLFTVVLVTAGVGVISLGIFPSGNDIARMLFWLVLTIVYVGLWQGMATLFSVIVKRSATSAFVALAVWLVLTIFLPLLISPLARAVSDAEDGSLEYLTTEASLSRTSPNTLYGESTQVLLSPDQPTADIVTTAQLSLRFPDELPLSQSLLIVVPQMVILLGLTIGLFAGAYALFMRQEVRA